MWYTRTRVGVSNGFKAAYREDDLTAAVRRRTLPRPPPSPGPARQRASPPARPFRLMSNPRFGEALDYLKYAFGKSNASQKMRMCTNQEHSSVLTVRSLIHVAAYHF